MSYTKHNFATGDVLYASQLRDIDDELYVLDGKVTTIEGQTSGLSNLSTLSSNFNTTLYVGQDKTTGTQNADLFLNPGAYAVSYACSNTPFHMSKFYSFSHTNNPTAYGHIFVFGYRPDRVNTNNCLMCQLFIVGDVGERDLVDLMADVGKGHGDIYTRYYIGSTWSDWVGYVDTEKYESMAASLISRIEALEEAAGINQGGSGGGSDTDKDGEEE